jgi:hypothetical protein
MAPVTVLRNSRDKSSHEGSTTATKRLEEGYHTAHLLSKRCAIRIKTSDVFFRQRNLLAVEQELAAPADGTKGVHDKMSRLIQNVQGKSSFASVEHYLLTYSTHGALLTHAIDDT